MTPFAPMRQNNLKWILLAILKFKWCIQLPITLESRFTCRLLKYFQSIKLFLQVHMVQYQELSAPVITEAKMYWPRKGWSDSLRTALLTKPHGDFMCRFFACYFTGEKAEEEWTVNTLPQNTHQDFNPEFQGQSPSYLWALVSSRKGSVAPSHSNTYEFISLGTLKVFIKLHGKLF